SFNVFASDSTEEAQGLLKWKAKLNQNQTHQLLSSWTFYPENAPTFGSHKTNTSPCTWFGIGCNHAGRVHSINLTSSVLQGTLQDFPFSSVPKLAYLDLSVNQLNGTIPSEIGHLSKLVYLDLQINELSGVIPPEIGLLTKLKTL